MFFVEVIVLLELFIVMYIYVIRFIFSTPCHNYKIYRNINNSTVLLHTFLL